MSSRLATFAEEIERLLGVRRDPESEREENRASSARQRTGDFQSKNIVQQVNVGHVAARNGQTRIVPAALGYGPTVFGASAKVHGFGKSPGSRQAGPGDSKPTSGAAPAAVQMAEAAINVFQLVLAEQEKEEEARMRVRGGSSRSEPVSAPSPRLYRPAQVAARAAFAAGAQEAVFKVISTTPSKTRAGALLDYLGTRDGEGGVKQEINVYTDDGKVLGNKLARQEYLNGFAANFKAELQNTNFIEVKFALDQEVGDQGLLDALNRSFEGKPFVFARSGNIVKVYALTDQKAAAISKALAGNEEKSRSKVVEKLENGFVDAFARNGISASAEIVAAVANERKAIYFLQKFIRANRGTKGADGVPVKGLGNATTAATKVFESWKKDMVPKHQRRNAFHLLFSAKAGTDPEAVTRAAKSVLEEKAHGHKYAFAHHGDTQHVHVHVMVQAVSSIGERLNFKKANLYEWREAFAEKAREQGVAMVSTRRQEHAKPRSYTKEHAGALRRAQQDIHYAVSRSTENRVLDKRSGLVDPQTSRRFGSETAAMWEQMAKAMAKAGVDPRFVAEAESLANNVARFSRDQAPPSQQSVLQRMDLHRHLKAAEGAKSPYAMKQAIDAINGAFRDLEVALSTTEKAELNEHRASFNNILAERLAYLQGQMDRSGLATTSSGDAGESAAADKSSVLGREHQVDVHEAGTAGTSALTAEKDHGKKANPAKHSEKIKARRHRDRYNDRGR